jgi:hypothetical protein
MQVLGIERLKLKHDKLFSNFAFNLNLRHYVQSMERAIAAGAHTRPLLSSTSAVLVSEPFSVQFVTIYDPYIYRYPAYPTKSAHVELRIGRV